MISFRLNCFSNKNPVIAGFFISALVAGTISLSGCTQGVQKLFVKPVAQLNLHKLSVKDFSDQLARKLKNQNALTAKDPLIVLQAKESVIRDFVIRSLLEDWAEENKVYITDEVVDKEVENLRKAYPDDLSFRKELAAEDLSFSQWRNQIKQSLLEKELFKRLNANVKPPENEEIKSYYEAHKDRYKRKERIFLRQIVVEDLIKAEAVKTALKKGDFKELAKQYSSGPEAKNGGEVGWIEKGTVEFLDPLFTAKGGSEIIQSPFGYHIVRVEKKASAGIISLEEAKAGIIRDLNAQREQAQYTAWLDTQLRKSKMLKDAELINSITVETKSNYE